MQHQWKPQINTNNTKIIKVTHTLGAEEFQNCGGGCTVTDMVANKTR